MNSYLRFKVKSSIELFKWKKEKQIKLCVSQLKIYLKVKKKEKWKSFKWKEIDFFPKRNKFNFYQENKAKKPQQNVEMNFYAKILKIK